MVLYYSPIDPGHIKKERAKAKELRNSQWWKLRLAEGICYHCGKRFEKEALTMDHLIPIGRGGRSNKGNIVVSCKECNSSKGSKTKAEMALDSLHTEKLDLEDES